jgi:hypothetical protein
MSMLCRCTGVLILQSGELVIQYDREERGGRGEGEVYRTDATRDPRHGEQTQNP